MGPSSPTWATAKAAPALQVRQLHLSPGKIINQIHHIWMTHLVIQNVCNMHATCSVLNLLFGTQTFGVSYWVLTILCSIRIFCEESLLACDRAAESADVIRAWHVAGQPALQRAEPQQYIPQGRGHQGNDSLPPLLILTHLS